MKLLIQSLLNSVPVMPDFLKEYEQELTITAAEKHEEQKTPVTKDEITTGHSYFSVSIEASFIPSVKGPCEEKKKARNAWSAVLGYTVVAAGGVAALVFGAPVALGALAAYGSAGYGAGLGAAAAVSGLASAKISDSMGCDTIKSEYWKEESAKSKYTPPAGSTIYAAPEYESTGRGRVKIHGWNAHGIEYEITAISGEYKVQFTSHEKHVHTVPTGAFKYR